MKKTGFRSILLLAIGVLSMALCYTILARGNVPAPEEPATDLLEPTTTFAATPTPALVGFDSICQEQQEILVEGFLHLPDSVRCVSGDEDEFCTVQLIDLVTRRNIPLLLSVGGERESPLPNHMLELPIPYDVTDLMVSTDVKRWVGEGSMVRVTGLAQALEYASSDGYDCRLTDVSRLEKLEDFSLVREQAHQSTLRAAIQEGWVEISITGDGLSRIDLKIEPKVNFNIGLEIEVGTIFVSDAADIQNMVVRKQSFAYITPQAEVEIELEVSCANMNKKKPGRENTFTVLADLAPQDLIALIGLDEFAFEPVRIQQFSIWTITDNPSRNGYVGLTAGFAPQGSGPTDDELARIRDLFVLAGLDIAKYNALPKE